MYRDTFKRQLLTMDTAVGRGFERLFQKRMHLVRGIDHRKPHVLHVFLERGGAAVPCAQMPLHHGGEYFVHFGLFGVTHAHNVKMTGQPR